MSGRRANLSLRPSACHESSPPRAEPAIFYPLPPPRLPGIFCLHNIYPTADTKSNGAWVPGGERPNEPTRSGTKAGPSSIPSTSLGCKLKVHGGRRTGVARGCGRGNKFDCNGGIVQFSQIRIRIPGDETTPVASEGKRGKREGVAGTP